MANAVPSFTDILSRIPTWVPLLLLLLISIGVLQRRSRAIRPVVTDVVAVVMLALSIVGVLQSFGPKPEALVPWLAGLGLARWLGPSFFGAGRLSAAGGGRVLVPGSWLPMTLMIGIFVLRVAVGVTQGGGLAVGSTATFAAVVAFGLGLCSGGFLVRALSIRRCARSPAGSRVAASC